MKPDLFAAVAFNAAKYARQMRQPAADIRYAIFFTPRSGSSWLHDIAKRTGRLGDPGECFNPSFVPVVAAAMNAGSLDQYVDLLVRRRNTQGVFGCQLTYHQLRATFGDDDRFLHYFPDAPSFWLIRRDIVLQAVSLSKKQQTKIGHMPALQAVQSEAAAAAEQMFGYDAEAIKRWAQHIHAAEANTETMIARHGLTPLRLSYEGITAQTPLAVVNRMCRHIGIAAIEDDGLHSDHAKIGTDKNTGFAERFIAEHPGFIAEMAEKRAGMLGALADQPPA